MLLNKVSLIGHKILKKDGKINAMTDPKTEQKLTAVIMPMRE